MVIPLFQFHHLLSFGRVLIDGSDGGEERGTRLILHIKVFLDLLQLIKNLLVVKHLLHFLLNLTNLGYTLIRPRLTVLAQLLIFLQLLWLAAMSEPSVHLPRLIRQVNLSSGHYSWGHYAEPLLLLSSYECLTQTVIILW